jgi:putative ABC transport system permease protein
MGFRCAVTLLQEVNHEMRRIEIIDTFYQDIRYGLWMLRRNPGFTFVAVLTLSLGIGANTAIFSVVNAMLLRSLPYYDPQRLVHVTGWEDVKEDGKGGSGSEISSAADYIHWREQSQTFDHLVAYTTGQTYLTERGEPEQLDAVRVTANLFPALGITPQLGRAFTPDEDRPGGALVAILSYAYWQRRFSGDPAIIGQSLKLDGRSRQVIGVMPAGFKFLSKADVLLPRALNVQQILANKGREDVGFIIGRLKLGATPEQARSDLDTILRRIREANPRHPYSYRALVTPLGYCWRTLQTKNLCVLSCRM